MKPPNPSGSWWINISTRLEIRNQKSNLEISNQFEVILMAPTNSTDQVLEIAKQERVRFLRLQFTDILGSIKNVEIPEP